MGDLIAWAAPAPSGNGDVFVAAGSNLYIRITYLVA